MARNPAAAGRLDLTSTIGLPLAVGLILLGQALEGGSARTLMQATAALIVLGGTAGSVMLSFSTGEVRRALQAVPTVFVDPLEPSAKPISRIVAYAKKARRLGLLSIEEDVNREPDPFLRRALNMAVDGISRSELRHTLEVEMDSIAEYDEAPSRVFDAAGGYAPTIGILGTIMSLVHVLGQLSEPNKLGGSIASAFLATLWGVLSANVLWLPIAKRIERIAELQAAQMELAVEGILAIQSGSNPRVVAQKLKALLPPGQLVDSKAA
jgi:chemotaxis protein MotA